ncbi:MAG: glycosyltransferase [Planctomycetota bacterium]
MSLNIQDALAPKQHTWSLAIATHNRPGVLRRCLTLAAEQTRPPVDAAICDSSVNPQPVREVVDDMQRRYPAIRWHYVRADPGIGHQRNLAWQHTAGDVAFLIDDDSLMYPDCAEHVMAVYDADTQGRVASVMAVLHPAAPDQADESHEPDSIDEPYNPDAGPSLTRRVVRGVKRLVDMDAPFPPYDGHFHEHPMPDALQPLGLGTARLVHGCRMTARRSVLEREPFSNQVRRAGGMELDASYRWSRHGLLTTCFQARLHHVFSSESRDRLHVRTTASAINTLAAAAFYAPDRRRAHGIVARYFRWKTLVCLLHDLKKRDHRLPRARGAMTGWAETAAPFRLPRERVWAWHRRAMQRHGVKGPQVVRKPGNPAALAAPAG